MLFISASYYALCVNNSAAIIPWYVYITGGLKVQMKKSKEAVKLFRDALRLDPGNKLATAGLEDALTVTTKVPL